MTELLREPGAVAERSKGMEIEELVQRQRDFFRTGRTKDVAFRIAALQKLENSIVTSQ